jgi:hypothetical protein
MASQTYFGSGSNMQTPIRMSELVTAARFYSSEEAAAFYELGTEAGARVRLLEPEMVGRGFDLSLGATERMVAFAVMVHPDDWDALEQATILLSPARRENSALCSLGRATPISRSESSRGKSWPRCRPQFRPSHPRLWNCRICTCRAIKRRADGLLSVP